MEIKRPVKVHHRSRVKMDHLLNLPADLKRKHSKDQMGSLALHHLVIRHRRISELAEIQAQVHLLVRERAHLVIKHTAIVAHRISHHLAVLALKPTHSVAQIITDQMLVPIQIHSINIIDRILLFRDNVNNIEQDTLTMYIRRLCFLYK